MFILPFFISPRAAKPLLQPRIVKAVRLFFRSTTALPSALVTALRISVPGLPGRKKGAFERPGAAGEIVHSEHR